MIGAADATGSRAWVRVAAPGTDPEALRAAVVTRLAAERRSDPAADVAAVWAELGVRAVLRGDPGYPSRLGEGWPGPGAPELLAWRGPRSLPAAELPAVALVGARRASPYGTGVAAWLAEAATDAEVVVVSGGALGIDAAAHRGALPGATVVVLGCGHDIAYPRPHAVCGGLFDRVLAAGGWLVSEHLPGDRPHPHRVRGRNRIVAGLADAVVVVEGGARSGALVTAGAAADLGRAVAAVPGDVRAPLSAAPHRLLHEGASPCTSPEDLLTLLGRLVPERAAGAAAPTVLPVAVRLELERRWPRPTALDDLADAAGVPVGALLAAVTRGRIAGELVEAPEGVRLARAPR